MASRGGRGGGGRGRGRGGFGGGGGYAKAAPVAIFPDIALPEKSILVKQTNGTYTTEEKILVQHSSKFQKFWESSPYYFEPASEKKGQEVDIQRFSDKNKPKHNLKRESLDVYIKCSSFPFELHDVLIGKKRSKKQKVGDPNSTARVERWGLEKLDMFEKLEQEVKKQEGSSKPKKDEDDDDEAEEGEEEDAEYSDDGDYNENDYCDDDEDDFNINDEVNLEDAVEL